MDNKIIHLLEAAVKKRQTLRKYTNALRLVNGVGDGLNGLVLEQYDRHFAAHIFNKRWLAEKEFLTAFVKKHFAAKYLIAKDRTQATALHPDKIKSDLWIKEDQSHTIVQENDLKFAVDLNDGLNSGLFLDMRRNRKIVAGLAKGRKVLNCFAYTCSFGVYCRKGAAASVVNVDVSRKSLERGRGNYELNHIKPGPDDFTRADAMQYLKLAVKKDNRFDVIILDPPSFARHEGKTFSVKKDLAVLIDWAIKVLNPNGVLFASTNFSGMSPQYIEKMVRVAAPGRRINKIRHLGQDDDFPGSGLTAESSLSAVLAQL